MYAIRTRRTTIDDRTVEQVVAYTREDRLSQDQRDDYILVDIDALPVPEARRGQAGYLVYDPNTKTVVVEYVDRPLLPEEVFEEELPKMQARLEALESEVEELKASR